MRQNVAAVIWIKYVLTDREIHNCYSHFHGLCLSFNDVLEIWISRFISGCKVHYIKIEQNGRIVLCADKAKVPKE